MSYSDAMSDSPVQGMEVDTEEAPPWVTELEDLYPNRHFRYRSLGEARDVELDGLDCRFRAYLCSNTVLNQHLVLFDLHVASMDSDSVDPSRMRSMLVCPAKEEDDLRPPCVRQAIAMACDEVICGPGHAERSGVHASEGLMVERDSCNVTLFHQLREGQGARRAGDDSPEPDWHACTHDDAERVTADRDTLRVSDETRVFFGGRVHHVVSASMNDMHVIRHIMLMLQVMWFFVPSYLREASKWHRQTLHESSGYDLDVLELAAKRLIHIYQTVRLQNEFAKYSYGVLCGAVYEPCERRWGVERSIDQFERYATFFQAFIKDLREVQSGKSERVLNYVLAGLGLFGIVGLWADILDSQVSVRELGSFRDIARIAGGSALGFTTVLFVAVSLLTAIWLVRYSMGIRSGKRGKRWRKARRRLFRH